MVNIMSSRICVVALVLLIAWSPPVGAQLRTTGAAGVAGRSGLSLRLGTWGQQGGDPLPDAAVINIRTQGSTIGLGYAYWLREDLALTLTASALAADVAIGAGVRTRTVVAALVGVRKYLSEGGPGAALRPYLTGGVGPYIGQEAGVRVARGLLLDERIVTVPGGHLGVGVDVAISRSLRLGVQGGYHVTASYSSALSDDNDYNGAEIGVEVGWIFGTPAPSVRGGQ